MQISQKKHVSSLIAVTIHYNRYLSAAWFSKGFCRRIASCVCTFRFHNLDLKNNKYAKAVFIFHRTDKAQNLLVEQGLFSWVTNSFMFFKLNIISCLYLQHLCYILYYSLNLLQTMSRHPEPDYSTKHALKNTTHWWSVYSLQIATRILLL